MKHNYISLLAISISLALSACGGGGGSSTDTPVPTPSYTPPPADSVSADTEIPAPVAIPLYPSALLISEISSSGWIEIYNNSNVPLDVSRVKLRTYDNFSQIVEFELPAATILANGYLVVAARSSNNIQSSNQVVFAGTTGQTLRLSQSGFAELVTPTQTIDFVRYGSDTTLPKFTAQVPAPWDGVNPNAPALNVNSLGNSIVRPSASLASDNNLGSDWQTANFVTPFGPNDVPSGTADADLDGIPDSAEVLGGKFAGLDLYGMGARRGQKDIFLEIDYMSSMDEGIKPRPEALQKIVTAFAAKGIALHIDAGTNVTGFYLGNTKSVLPFNSCLDLGNPIGACADVYNLKNRYFDARRNPIFHYAVMGFKQGTYAGAAGLGEILGNDFNVTLGGLGLSAKTALEKNFLINTQAATIMHELGHNLGLGHGGFDPVTQAADSRNGKPNYLSVMNYMYSQAGIPPNPTGSKAGQRWSLYKDLNNLSLCSADIEANTCSDNFILDYSAGTSQSLNENSLLESELLGRGSTDAVAFIDWDRNGVNTLNRISANIDDSVSKEVLTDSNDWALLKLNFSRFDSGRLLVLGRGINSGPVDFLNDQQPIAHELPMVKAMP